MLTNIHVYGRRYKISNRHSLRHPVPDIRGGDIDQVPDPDIGQEPFRPGRRQVQLQCPQNGQIDARPRNGYNPAKRKQMEDILPEMQLHQ